MMGNYHVRFGKELLNLRPVGSSYFTCNNSARNFNECADVLEHRLPNRKGVEDGTNS